MSRPVSRADMEQFTLLLEEVQRRIAARKFERMFPAKDTPQLDGSIIHARDLYPKHLDFFKAGSQFRERCFMAANRVGKTEAGAYETTAHLTGMYPDWWEGKRFTKPVRAWAAGKTNETTRDIIQAKLLGEIVGGGSTKGVSGTGMIPGRHLGKITWKAGVADLIDTIKVRHISGGWSTLGLKSYQQGRGSFEGTEQHLIWLDEECPQDVYGECLVRTATTSGIIILTFTPLDGLSEVVMSFLPADQRPAGHTND